MNLYNYKGKCVRVIDGDTVELEVDLGFEIKHKITARLLDVHAPEVRTKDLIEKAKGLYIKHDLSDLLMFKDVEIVSNKKGKYGRWLCTIYLDGLNVNEEINKWIEKLTHN